MWGAAEMTANKSMIIEQWRAFLMTCLYPHAEANVEYQYNAAHQHGSSRGNDVWPALSRSAHTWLWVTSMNVQMSQVGRKSSSYDSSGRSHSRNTSGLNFVVMLTLHKSRWDSEWQLVHPRTRHVNSKPILRVKTWACDVLFCRLNPFLKSTLQCRYTTTLGNAQTSSSQVYSYG